MVSVDINHVAQQPGIVPERDPMLNSQGQRPGNRPLPRHNLAQTQRIMIRATDELKIRLSWPWEQNGWSPWYGDEFKSESDFEVFPAGNVKQENVPSWGLAHLSCNKKLTNVTKGRYFYDDSAAGQGTTAYILDTGVFAGHDDFEGRASLGFNAIPGSSNTDMDGHGTHVAGIVGGKLYGVAKKARLVAIKVIGENGLGSVSDVIAGLEWAVRDAQRRGGKAVINMSIASQYSRALNRSVRAAVQSGLAVIVAAGNDGKNAKNYSPASEISAVTVGATDEGDNVPDFSNYGPLVNIFAPGAAITSAWVSKYGRTDRSMVRRGTSMAAPHVTGLALCWISKDKSTTYTPKGIGEKIMALALKNQLEERTLREGSPNVLANNGLGLERA